MNPRDTTTISRQLIPRAILRLAAPGKPRNLKIATGIVVNSTLTRIKDAPNSPMDTANANVAPTNRAGAINGNSIKKKTLVGFAPSTAAASLRFEFIPFNTGSRLLITNG
jgi:hypothetical protein